MKLNTWLVRVSLAALLALATTGADAGQNDDKSHGFWMATSHFEPALNGRSWGRLTLRNGELAFASSDYEWRIALSEIARVEVSKTAARAFEIESASGEVHYVAIFDAKLVTESPGKAVETIRRAHRSLAASSRQR
jgi:hypothetical protein